MSRDRQRKLFIELINKQLEPFGKTYEEVVDMPNWYMNFQTTQEEQKKFTEYCVSRISKELGLTKKLAEMEASWFILQWGLTSVNPRKTPNRVQINVNKRTKS